jgi:hypothetical protein
MPVPYLTAWVPSPDPNQSSVTQAPNARFASGRMKTQKPMRALLAGFVLLVGISSTDAALCTEETFGGAGAVVLTCDCPLGTGPAGSLVSALPTKASPGYATEGGDAAAQLSDAQDALDLCVDLLPGYEQATGTGLPTVCATADEYCPGHPALYSAGVTCSGDDTDYTTIVLGATISSLSNTDTHRKSLGGLSCPTGTTTTGSSGPFTLDKCLVTLGDYVSAIDGTTFAVTVATCSAGFTCPVVPNAAWSVASSAPVSCAGGGNSGAGGFICPAGTTGVLGTTIAASLTALTGEIICGAGSAPDSGYDGCDALDGFYGPANQATGSGTPSTTPALTACPTGVTGTTATTLASACTDIAPGYNVLSSISGQYAPGTVAALEAGITACSGLNTYCPGKTSVVALTGTTASLVTYPSIAKLTAGAKQTACPTGTGNAVTGATAQGINAISPATGCLDLLPNYAFGVSVASSAVIANHITTCSAGKYNCVGSAGFFSGSKAASTGLTTATDLSLVDPGDGTASVNFGAVVVTGATGSMLVTDCPTGTTNTAGGGLISSCVTSAGKYIDVSDTAVTQNCPIGEYCVGGTAVGTAGGNTACPTGSVGPAAASAENSHISDCKLSEGFYIAAGALSTPVPCLTGNVCAGGSPVGIAGGSVACPAGSTNTACSGTASGSTTVNLTPASQPITVDVAAPTPAVTVTNTVPSASSASSTVASMVVVTVAALVAF